MNDLQTFFAKLATWEGEPAACLAAPWTRTDTLAVASDFRRAFSASRLATRPLPIAAGTNNQTVGNRVAEFIQKQLDSQLQRFRIMPCQGPGYPDYSVMLRRHRSKLRDGTQGNDQFRSEKRQPHGFSKRLEKAQALV